MVKNISFVLIILVLFHFSSCIGLSTNGYSFPKVFENSNMSSIFNGHNAGLIFWVEGLESHDFNQRKKLVVNRLYSHFPINTDLGYIDKALSEKGFSCKQKPLTCSISATTYIYDGYVFTKKCLSKSKNTFELKFIGNQKLKEILIDRRQKNTDC